MFIKKFIQRHGLYNEEQFNCERDWLRRKLVDIQFEVENGVIFLNAFNLNNRQEKDARLPGDVKCCLAPYGIKQYAAVVRRRLLSQYLRGPQEGMLDSSQKESMSKMLFDIGQNFAVAVDRAKYMNIYIKLLCLQACAKEKFPGLEWECVDLQKDQVLIIATCTCNFQI